MIYIKRLLVFLFIIIMMINIAGCRSNDEREDETETTNIEENIEAAGENEDLSEENKNNEYNIYLEVDTEKKIITGIEKVKITNKSEDEWDKIYFNTFLNAFNERENAPVFDNALGTVYKYGTDSGNMGIINLYVQSEEVKFKNEGTTLEIELEEGLKPKSETEITIHFEAKIPKICHRTGYNDKAIWCGNFIPNLCIYDNGWKINEYCRAGEPAYTDTANYNVNIKVPKGYTVVGSGMAETEENDEGVIYCFNSRMIRDFAFAVSDSYIKDTRVTKSGVEINYYHYTDGSYSNNKISEEYLNIAEKSLEYYGEKISPYPYNVLNIAEVELWGDCGMEYPEIIFMDSGFIQKEYSVPSVAHETAHQWFYNIVGNDQYKDAWLDEGLASFAELGVYMSDEEIENYIKRCYYEIKACYENGYDNSGGYITDRNISKFESWATYYYSEYEKPMIMMYELNRKMGEAKFNEFLRDYYKNYSFKNADKDKFEECAERAYGKSLGEFFAQWLENEGIPEIIWEED